jgi:hypothetical protein
MKPTFSETVIKSKRAADWNKKPILLRILFISCRFRLLVPDHYKKFRPAPDTTIRQSS